ncbi:MAG: hypothetical protein H6779_05315 [Candidatus Nomurabacteria bacterium]|nr:MAG: hypothetical protein H6779_05315 [Candidatus Nomurabacteria bacterium]
MLLKGKELLDRADELGIDTKGDYIYQSSMGRRDADEYELQRRVIEAERSIRESKLWIIAVVSAAASVVSAATALVAILLN